MAERERHLKIIVDENIPFGREAFGGLGEVVTLHGRKIDARAVRDADLLIVDGNPLEDLTALQRVQTVILNGQVVIGD